MMNRRFSAFSLLAMTMGITATVACTHAPDAEGINSDDNLNLNIVHAGIGIDGPADEVRAFCLNPLTFRYQQVAGADANGQVVKSELYVVERSEQLRNSLNISAAAHIRWLAGKVDATLDTAMSQEVKATSVYAVLHVNIQNATGSSDVNAKLSPDAENLFRQDGQKRFRELCGTHYVRGMTTGGDLYAILEVKTRDEADRQEIAVKVSGSAWGQSASVDVKNKLEEAFSSRELSIGMIQSGGLGESAGSCSDLPCLLERYRTFSTTVKDHPRVIAIDPVDYGAAVRAQDSVTPFDTRNAELIQKDMSLEQLAQRDTIAACHGAVARPSTFLPFDPAEVQVALNNANANIAKLRDAARTCYLDATKCALPTDLASTAGRPTKRPIGVEPAPAQPPRPPVGRSGDWWGGRSIPAGTVRCLEFPEQCRLRP